MIARTHAPVGAAAALRSGLIRAGAASGALLAAWYGIHHPGRLSDCAGVRASASLQRCVDGAASPVLWHWVAILAGGTVAGLVLGVGTALLFAPPRGR